MNILFQNYLTRGFWGDEAWTALISRLSVPDILVVTGQDFHPPLYYLAVHQWIQFFGNSEWIRLISTFFFVLTWWPLYVLITQLVPQKINKILAVLGTTLVAASPILFIYAFEARSYAMVTFISVLSTLFFWQALQAPQATQALKISKTTKALQTTKALRAASKKKASQLKKQLAAKSALKWWLLYGVTAALGVYTHYYLWFIFAAHGFFWLIADRQQLKSIFVTYLSVVLVQLPWLPTLFSQVKTVAGDYWIGAMNSQTHWEYFMRIIAGDFTTTWQQPLARIMLMATLLSLVVVLLKNKARLPKGYVLLWVWWLVPVILPTLVSFYKPVFFYRYLVFTSVPILLIIFWGLVEIKKDLAYILGVLLLVFYLRTDYLIFAQYPLSYREAVKTAFSSQNPPAESAAVYTYLPSFAEVEYYVNFADGQKGQRAPVKVVPVGLVQFSGRSLLDKYQALGLVEIQDFPTAHYWKFDQGPNVTWHW